MADLVTYSEETFESIKHINEYGQEFWYARELQIVLEYTDWRNFSKVIEKAQTACTNSGAQINDHFVGVNKMVDFNPLEFDGVNRDNKKSPTGCSRKGIK